MFLSLPAINLLQHFWCQHRTAPGQAGNESVEEDARRVGQYGQSEPLRSVADLAGRLLTTVYMGTENSSKETQARAADLAAQVPAGVAPSCCLACLALSQHAEHVLS